MLIQLDQIQDEPFEWQTREEIDLETLERQDLVALSPIEWQGKVSRTDPGFLLTSRFRYDQTLRCDRCLVETAGSVDGTLDLLVLVQKDEPGRSSDGEEIELNEADLGVLVVPDEVLDTDPLLVEQIQLGVPMKPLCREDCKGLCPHCGADLNEGPCDCDEDETDPRWAALAALRDQLEDRK